MRQRTAGARAHGSRPVDSPSASAPPKAPEGPQSAPEAAPGCKAASDADPGAESIEAIQQTQHNPTSSAAVDAISPSADPDAAAEARTPSAAEVEKVKQQLDPLTTYDEEERAASTLLPQTELEQVPIMKNVSYRSPQCHRRRPGNSIALAARNFAAECKGLIVAVLERFAKPDQPSLPEAFGFTLSNDAIHEFDVEHPPPGREPAPAFIKLAYDVLLFFVDRVYEGKAIERFWFLETVARMPYFSYTTCLHLYETMGWWRTGGLRVVHFAEEWNELHHLLIMEALGGDRRWQDRFLGQHAAVFYYWGLVLCFLVSPKWSYKFSEMLETHAVSTYRQFIIENGQQLKKLPAPKIAQEYYLSGDPYLFNMDSALVRGPGNAEPRTPPCGNLYDVFVNILEDEWEHVKTMVMCQDYDLMESLKVTQTEFAQQAALDGARRELWNQWARDINEMDRMIEMRKM